jgi:catechol 2,3-dioxygenase-like lactoylglutathione lyase family enzyme
MIKVRRIGHATFETPDLERQIEHFTSVTGLVLAAREKDRALLTTRIGQLAIQLKKGDEPRCAKLAFQVAPGSDFKELEKSLAADGIKSELRSDDLPGTPKLLTFEDNKGTTIEIFTEWDYLSDNQQVIGVGPMKLGHCAFIVKDLQATCDFYERVLGFKVSDWNGDFFVFMRCNPDHHTVNFVRGKKNMMHHIAFEVRDFSAVEQGCDVLSLHQIPILWGPLRHGPGHNVSIYHRNPDKHMIEFFAELDQVLDEELGYFDPRPWHTDRPQRPKVWTKGNRSVSGWGPPPTAEYHLYRDE